MQLAHIGVAVFIVGVTIVTGYQSEQDVRMEIGDTVNAGGYTFRFNGVSRVAGPNYEAARAEIEVSRNGNVTNMMYPEKRSYAASGNVMTETAIDSGVFRDLYISLGEPVGEWRLERARLLQTIRLLDLGRRSSDGAGRRPGAERSPLRACRSQATCSLSPTNATTDSCRGDGRERSMTRFVIPLVLFRCPGRFSCYWFAARPTASPFAFNQ